MWILLDDCAHPNNNHNTNHTTNTTNTNNKSNVHNRGRPADIYALGACLYTFVFGRIPFNASSVAKLFQVVQTQPLQFPDSTAV